MLMNATGNWALATRMPFVKTPKDRTNAVVNLDLPEMHILVKVWITFRYLQLTLPSESNLSTKHAFARLRSALRSFKNQYY